MFFLRFCILSAYSGFFVFFGVLRDSRSLGYLRCGSHDIKRYIILQSRQARIAERKQDISDMIIAEPAFLFLQEEKYTAEI